LRLLNAKSEPQNWLMVYGDYSSHMSSALSQINRTNVSQLKPKFMVSLMNYNLAGASGEVRNQQTPLVNDGYMYVNSGINRVFKIDVRSGDRGEVLWVNDPEINTLGYSARGRGISLLGDSVYTPTVEARLLRIDATSGETVWDISAAAPAPEGPNQGITAASLAVKDMIIVPHATGSGHGHRAWLAAFDAETGAERWRFFMVPGPGEPGHETWADDHNAYLVGGAALWTTPSYDAEANIVMIGTGDPAPWSAPEWRPGDNLYSMSTVALDADTGELKWYFQEIPNESWDYDTVNPRMLYDVEVAGEMRQVEGHFSRNGFYYTLDRRTGEFLWAKPYTEVNWTKWLDPKTGKPIEYDPAQTLQEYAGRAQRYGDLTRAKDVCPYFSGQPTNWPPHFDESRMMAYQQAHFACADYQRSAALPEGRGEDWVGGGAAHGIGFGTGSTLSRGAPLGVIHGIDVRTGEVKVRHTNTFASRAGVMGTAGDLVFVGEDDGTFGAYDKDTLAQLWSFNVGTGIRAPAMTYAVGGQQYVAVVAGQSYAAKNIQTAQMLVVFGL
jgi:alcohol dehydrogenase (cytochrome c)